MKARSIVGACLALGLAMPAAAGDGDTEEIYASPGTIDIRSELAALKREPSVREVQEAALRYFKVNIAKVDSMRSGAAYKAAVPVLEVAGGYVSSRIDDDTIDDAYSQNVPKLLRGVGASAWEVRGKATWNFPQLIFNPEELDVTSLTGLMEGILKESTRLYFMRRRLQVDMLLTPPTDQATLLTKQLRMEELSALLDAMTGGWFAKALAGEAPKVVP